jgi:hypothetical protein
MGGAGTLERIGSPDATGAVWQIDAEQARCTEGSKRPIRRGRRAALVAAALIVAVIAAVAFSAPAFAGQSSTGKQAFVPCTRCHPVFVDANDKPTKPLPNGFKKHEITLEVHDILGKGGEACLACHESPTTDPGKLKTPDGSLVDVTGDVSRVCQKCHFEKYRDWQAGIHGKRAPKCTSGGCHDPHTPSWIYVAALPPFQGTGLEVRAVGKREPFKPLASPPLPAPVTTSLWLVIVASLGAVVSAGILAYLVLGRSKR